ncbi:MULTISPECIES: D-Ala-D-Ala carboxypeptidase family metallohydrolase [Hyphobacterium]|uniref:D-Ala-D-Ala carboxypeptidase family metallohydrolase n=1 Tax=Hyphobacterium vulgare TaxID=1736751 RepID=A0ABV7A0M4_9PROT
MKRLSYGLSLAVLAVCGAGLPACGAPPERETTIASGDAAPEFTTTRLSSQGPAIAEADVSEEAASEADTAENAESERGVPAETLSIDGKELPFTTWHHLAMPGETVTFEADAPIELFVDGEKLGDAAEQHEWTAPDAPGTFEVRLVDEMGDARDIALFVMAPLDGATVMEGYRIGEYPQNAPAGLIRLTQEDLDVPVSPSFTIGQFICKQQPGHWPKFVLVSPNLLRRLEAVLTEMQTDDLTEAESLFVMSGYRTPFYNTAIRSARLSRHMYGDAADIYPDVIGNDAVMDDLDGDGRITRADAEFLYDYAEDLFAEKDLPEGGIGAYDANAVHGPFVHIDGRGTRARWGRYGS